VFGSLLLACFHVALLSVCTMNSAKAKNDLYCGWHGELCILQ